MGLTGQETTRASAERWTYPAEGILYNTLSGVGTVSHERMPTVLTPGEGCDDRTECAEGENN